MRTIRTGHAAIGTTLPYKEDLFSISIYFSKMACVVSYGAELYRVEAKNEETLRKSGHGTPNAWMGWNVYAAR
jgi:hypothetical protein